MVEKQEIAGGLNVRFTNRTVRVACTAVESQYAAGPCGLKAVVAVRQTVENGLLGHDARETVVFVYSGRKGGFCDRRVTAA